MSNNLPTKFSLSVWSVPSPACRPVHQLVLIKKGALLLSVQEHTSSMAGTWNDLPLLSSFALRPCPLCSLKSLPPKWGASGRLSNVFCFGLGDHYLTGTIGLNAQ